MEGQEKTADDHFPLESIILNEWASKEEDINAPLGVVALKMNNTSEPKDQNSSLEQITTNNMANWSHAGDTINNTTLLYIAVEYLKNNGTSSSTSVSEQLPPDSYSEFPTPCVSPLDPNMSSVARYSPAPVQYQQNPNAMAPIVIHQYAAQARSEPKDFEQNINTESTLSSEMNNVLCGAGENQYLQMLNDQNNINEGDELQLMADGDQQEVELLITDHTTGISYSVNAQDILVESCMESNQQLLGINAQGCEPNLTSHGNDNTLNPEHNNENLNSTIVTSVNEEVIKNYIDYLSNKGSICDDTGRMFARRNNKATMANVNEEEHLLSCVYSITDRPILTMARASLPESLSIVKIQNEDAVMAKKLISKSSQFGPLKGALNLFTEENKNNYKYFMALETDSYVIDTSDENNSNWMSFVRHATTYEEQNLIITQEGNGVFFTAVKQIMPKEELKVGYSASYATQFNLPVLKSKQRKKWRGFECSEMFGISEELEKHFAMQDQDAKNFKRKCRKPNRLQSDQDVVECKICQELFATNISYYTLQRHLVHRHQYVGTNVGEQFTIHKYFQCNVCGMCFKIGSLLNIHKLEHDSELPLDHPNHVCPQCQKKFPTRKQLVHHVACHSISRDITRDLKIKCHICHKLFNHSLRLQKHMLCHDSDETKPLQCKDCNKRFLTSAGMAIHSRSHLRPGENRFECPICNKTFDQVLTLRNHIPTHAHNNSYSCPICQKTFQKYCILRKHMKFHTERKLKCPDCPKTFKTPDLVKKHMLRHSDHKEFLCADCGKQFKRKDKLADHIRKLHMQRVMDAKTTVRFRSPKKRVTEPTDFHRFIYKCHSCFIGFKRRGMLVNHLAKRHPDIRPNSVPELNLPIIQTMKEYQCQYCDKVYQSTTKRKVHTLKVHPGAPLPTTSGERTTARKVTATANPESCQWCHRQYARKNKLLQHIKKVHPTIYAEIEIVPKERYKKNPTKDVDKSTFAPQVKTSPKSQKSIIKPKVAFEPTFLSQEQQYQNMLEKPHATTDGNMTEIMPAVMDGLIDDDSKYCHQSIDENEIMQGGQLDSHNSRLYRLLTSGNGMMPPR